MVNFHALASYFEHIGGDVSLQETRLGIKTSLFASGFKFSALRDLSLAIDEQVHGFSPGDYFMLHTRISESFKECSVATLAAHMQLALWDPHVYLKMSAHIISKIVEEDKD